MDDDVLSGCDLDFRASGELSYSLGDPELVALFAGVEEDDVDAIELRAAAWTELFGGATDAS